MNFDPAQALRLARATLDIEAAAVLGLKDRLGDSFARALALILRASGRVVVMGMGKSGHVGRKIAATLASTGTPAMFVHPAEASHGDLGMIQARVVALLLRDHPGREGPVQSCSAREGDLPACVAGHVARARAAGQGWLLVSRADRLEPGWWAQATARLPAPAPVRAIELPFRMVRAGTAPAHYQYLWQPPQAPR